VQSTLEKLKNAIFAIFRKFKRTFFLDAFSENLKMQDVSSILLLQECAVKTDSYENWVGNSKISCKVKMFYTPGFFSFVSAVIYQFELIKNFMSTVIFPFSIFGVFLVLKTWILVGFYLKFQ
jgi:hypothetical protein